MGGLNGTLQHGSFSASLLIYRLKCTSEKKGIFSNNITVLTGRNEIGSVDVLGEPLLRLLDRLREPVRADSTENQGSQHRRQVAFAFDGIPTHLLVDGRKQVATECVEGSCETEGGKSYDPLTLSGLLTVEK